MNKIVVSIVASSAMFVSYNSFAFDGNFYVEGQGGITPYLQIPNLLPAKKLDSHTNFAFAIRAGYLASLTENWFLGLEGGYINLGKFNVKDRYDSRYADSLNFKQQGGDLLAVGQYRFDNGVSIFAKAGAADVRQVARFSNYSYKTTKILPEIAGGLGYQLTDNLALTGNVSHIFGNLSNRSPHGVGSTTTTMVGLKYSF